MARLLDKGLELPTGQALGAVHRLGQPARPACLGVSAQIDSEFPGILATSSHRSTSHKTATVRQRSWASHGQLMGRLDDGRWGWKRNRWSQDLVWSGRRDSNPRPPPWQKNRAQPSSANVCPCSSLQVSDASLVSVVSSKRQRMDTNPSSIGSRASGGPHSRSIPPHSYPKHLVFLAS
jgi:hypothetical protein